ncbi:hypothetical protein [Snodgrassella gandavensis]|uniref:hypothetical protein n=1 Tax=Snodgrassella gandavensis TaxID=2946698 RepID=UPI001EF56F3E|nr:hypothetical protein [Snodgrassella gandavensis]
MITNSIQRQTTWLPPQPVRWLFWLALYILAITINKKYADSIIAQLGLEITVHWQKWCISVLPAVAVVTLLLLVRCIWYQIWLIYQRHNQFIYNEKVVNNQKYWSEFMLLEEVLLRCGQLNHAADFYDYLSLSSEERKESVFESMSMEMPTQNSSVVHSDRLHTVLSQLVQTLSSKEVFTEQYVQHLWLWAADRESWLIFRELVIAEGGYCPVVPDYYVKFEDLNWVIDRFQEALYQKILLLGFECQPEFELYLAMIFARKGKLATIRRAFDTHTWDADQEYFFTAMTEKISGFQLESSPQESIQPEDTELTEALIEKDYEIKPYKLDHPEFFQKLQYTSDWMQLLLAVYQAHKHSYVVLFQHNEKIIPVAQVK